MPTAAEIIANPVDHYPLHTVACFDPTCGELPRRQLDKNRCREFLSRIANAGANAVLIAASTGHGHLRTIDELSEWFEVAASADLGDCCKMALLRPEDGADANEKLVAQLAALNYAVVFVRPGTDLPPTASAADIAANMHPLVAAAARHHLAIGLYSIPDVSGLPMPVDTVDMLMQDTGGKNIVAIKVTEENYENSTAKFLADPRLTRLKIVQGWDPHLARALKESPLRCGVTSGPMSFAVYQYLHLFGAASENNWEEVEAAQSAVSALFSAMQDDPTKFADLQRAKAVMGLGDPITGEATLHQRQAVINALTTLPRVADRERLAASLDLMGDGPCHEELGQLTKN